MRKLAGSITAFMLLIISITIVSCNNNETKPVSDGSNISKDSMIKRGEYLVTIMVVTIAIHQKNLDLKVLSLI